MIFANGTLTHCWLHSRILTYFSEQGQKSGSLNPFTLRAPKTVLTILEIFYLQKHFLENMKEKC